jgi:hypothetical protein
MYLSYRIRPGAGNASIECVRVAPERHVDPWRAEVSKASFQCAPAGRLGDPKLIEFTQATPGALFIPHLERK